MKKVLVIGSMNMDLVTETDVIPSIGETVIGNAFNTVPGGKGANQAVAAARLGLDVTMLGCVGGDLFGNELIDNLKRNNVNTGCVTALPGISTGIATIVVHKGDNFIILAGGANQHVSLSMLERFEEQIFSSDYIMLQNEIPLEINMHILNMKHKDARVLYNPAPSVSLPESLYRHIDIFVPNQHECADLIGNSINSPCEAIKAAKEFREKGVKNVVITMGGDGAVFNDGNDYIHAPAEKITPVDTTAAGDSFCAGIISALAQGKTMREAIFFATRVAAITVVRQGAQSSLPYLSEVLT